MVMLMGLLSFFGMGCNKGTSTQVTAVSPKEAEGMLRNDFAVLLDVRETDEIKDGMATPAQWVPMTDIQSNGPKWNAYLSKLSKDKQVIIYCAKGGRAGKVANLLAEKGFRAANMGGFNDWAKAGLPTKKPNN